MKKRFTASERISFIANLIMIFVYLSAGIFIFFVKTNFFPGLKNQLFGTILILYAAYRGYSFFTKWRKSTDEI